MFCILLYIYRERETERQREGAGAGARQRPRQRDRETEHKKLQLPGALNIQSIVNVKFSYTSFTYKQVNCTLIQITFLGFTLELKSFIRLLLHKSNT